MTPCSLPVPVRQTLEQRQRFGSLSSLLDPVRIRKQQEQYTEIPPMAAYAPGLRAAWYACDGGHALGKFFLITAKACRLIFDDPLPF